MFKWRSVKTKSGRAWLLVSMGPPAHALVMEAIGEGDKVHVFDVGMHFITEELPLPPHRAIFKGTPEEAERFYASCCGKAV